MVRIIAALVGIFFTGWLLVSFGVGAYAFLTEPHEETATHMFHREAEPLALASNGPMGQFDTQQLQRGFGVFRDVCSACHSLRHVHFRDLAQIGYNEDEISAIAANWPLQTPTIDSVTGEPTTRPAEPNDTIPMPFANETAARAANNNALPPDLSLITKAREGGHNYVHSLLTGYQDPPEELRNEFPDALPTPGLYYNPYFANLNLAMAPPLVVDGQVTYGDGTTATVDQMATDVTAFLVWTAEPSLEKRHQTGWAVIAFLLLATILAFLSYRSIWADKKH